MENIQDLSSFKLPKGARGRNRFLVQIWYIVNSTLFAFSPQFMNIWRIILLRIFGAKIGKGVIVRSSVVVTYPWKLVIEDNSWIGENVTLYNLDNIHIGKNVVVSQQSYLCTGSHSYEKFDFPLITKPILINDEVWIAADVFIFLGVEIGKGCVVGSRSSVYNNLPEMAVCIGNPAKKVKNREITSD